MNNDNDENTIGMEKKQKIMKCKKSMISHQSLIWNGHGDFNIDTWFNSQSSNVLD